MRSIASKILAAGAAVALATGGMLAVTASPAAAAPKMELSSKGPFKGGEKITVKLSGFTPNAPIAVGIIPASRFPAEGPGDACAQKLGCSALTVADAQGNVTKELTVVKGPIENSKAPAEKCDADNDCVFGAANINQNTETVKVDITYAASTSSGGGSSSGGSSSSGTNTSSGGNTSGGTTSSGGTSGGTTSSGGTDSATDSGTLPKTGPAETMAVALLGLAVFQLGLILAVRSIRRTPRRISA
jgi:LPXTG-motif cell wall-anchored protein